MNGAITVTKCTIAGLLLIMLAHIFFHFVWYISSKLWFTVLGKAVGTSVYKQGRFFSSIQGETIVKPAVLATSIKTATCLEQPLLVVPSSKFLFNWPVSSGHLP